MNQRFYVTARLFPGLFCRVAMGLVVLLPGSVMAGQDGELLENGDFEVPQVERDRAQQKPNAWESFSSVTDSDGISVGRHSSHTGRQSLRMDAQGKPGSHQGVFQVVPVREGATYTFSSHVLNDRMEGTMRGQMSIEWRNEYDEEIHRSWGPEWNRSLPRSRWNRMELTVQAPSSAMAAVIVVSQYDDLRSKNRGSFLVDNVSVREVSP